MKNFILISLLMLASACDQRQKEEVSLERSGRSTYSYYDPDVHKLGSEEEWKKIRNSVLFHIAEESPAVLSAPGEREDKYDPELILETLHSWFQENVGYTVRYDGRARLLILNRIPDQVMREVISRMSADPTGFGILDAQHWKTVQSMQRQGYKVAVVSRYPIPIAGLNIGSKKLVAFDILANSGTLTHELRHQLQHDRLNMPWTRWGEDISSQCKQKLSAYFAEWDSTTTQLKEWGDIVMKAKIHVDNLADYAAEGGDATTPTMMRALAVNLEYPISHAMVVLAEDDHDDEDDYGRYSYRTRQEGCPEHLKEIVRQAQALAGKQKVRIFTSDESEILSGQLRVETSMLIEERFKCGDAQGPDCVRIEDQIKEIGQRVTLAKQKIRDELNRAFEERDQLMKKLLKNLKWQRRGEFKELCNEVKGIALMTTECGW